MGKRHLYLASYDDTRTHGQALRLHWALIVGPPPGHEDPHSHEKTNTRYHATRTNGRWELDRRHIECVRTPAMLCRVRVGTVEERHLGAVDRELGDPRRIRAGGVPRWDCRGWVEDALGTLVKEGWLWCEGGLWLDHLFAFAQRVSEEIAREGLNVGYGLPITVKSPRRTS